MAFSMGLSLRIPKGALITALLETSGKAMAIQMIAPVIHVHPLSPSMGISSSHLPHARRPADLTLPLIVQKPNSNRLTPQINPLPNPIRPSPLFILSRNPPIHPNPNTGRYTLYIREPRWGSEPIQSPCWAESAGMGESGLDLGWRS